MHSMETYARVSMFDIEIEIENALGETAEAQELEQLCRESMKTKPTAFSHTADMLHAKGYSDIVHGILDSVSNR